MSAAEKEVRRYLPTTLRRQASAISGDDDSVVLDEDEVAWTEADEWSAGADSTNLVVGTGWARAHWSAVAEWLNTFQGRFVAQDASATRQNFRIAASPTETTSSPFEDLLTTKSERAKTAIAAAPNVPRITERLNELVDLAAEEYPQTEIPNREALTSALEFFAAFDDLSRPLLGLTSAGHVWAEWIKQSDRSERVALEFRKSGAITLAATFRDAVEPLRRASAVVGNLSARSAAEKLRTDGVLRWVVVPPEKDG